MVIGPADVVCNLAESADKSGMSRYAEHVPGDIVMTLQDHPLQRIADSPLGQLRPMFEQSRLDRRAAGFVMSDMQEESGLAHCSAPLHYMLVHQRNSRLDPAARCSERAAAVKSTVGIAAFFRYT